MNRFRTRRRPIRLAPLALPPALRAADPRAVRLPLNAWLVSLPPPPDSSVQFLIFVLYLIILLVLVILTIFVLFVFLDLAPDLNLEFLDVLSGRVQRPVPI